MAVWLLIVLTGIVLAAWWFYTRRLDWQFRHIASQLSGITRERQMNAAAAKRVMRQIYKVLKASLIAGKADNAYRAFDMLKLALGHGLGRAGEPVRITAAIYLALRSNQPDAAGHGIDAFRPLLKNVTTTEIPAVVEQLGLIAVISLKQRHNFLAARAVEVIFASLYTAQDAGVRMAVMRALKLTGLTALRRGDAGLIREIQAKLAGWLAAEPLDSMAHEQAVGVLTAWLLRVVKAGDACMIDPLTDYIRQLAEKKVLSDNALASIVAECNHIAGMDSLNPFSQVAGAISMLSLDLAVQVRGNDTWRQAVDGAGQAARLAVAQRSLAESFDIVYPLFEAGRRLLTAELNSGPVSDLFRQQALYTLMRECLQLVEFVSRQSFTTTAADIIDQLYLDWIKRPANAGQQKSIKKFCQLLFLYCTRLKRRQKRLTADGSSFNAPNTITLSNRERLTQLGYLF
ncbi:hypothetical protein [Sporomusa sp.]|uniref:hypothetical protein n=1 Tax=Sporomusa sp. TaxID=2078658 RepID=UPI002BCE94F8|nr:hypothetical protein [Sporomusa sp.]HWR43769.1 hypothetical protein [Sporomusa sp.]